MTPQQEDKIESTLLIVQNAVSTFLLQENARVCFIAEEFASKISEHINKFRGNLSQGLIIPDFQYQSELSLTSKSFEDVDVRLNEIAGKFNQKSDWLKLTWLETKDDWSAKGKVYMNCTFIFSVPTMFRNA